LNIADVVKMPVNAVRLRDQIEEGQIVNRDDLIRGPIVSKERAGFWMRHAVRFRDSQRPRANLLFAVGSGAIQFMNPGPAFFNRLTGSSLISVVVLLATPSPNDRGG
jgi:hypothetical protein